MTENAKKVFIYLTRCHFLNEGIVPEPEEIADKLGLTEEETRISIDEVFTLIKEQL